MVDEVHVFDNHTLHIESDEQFSEERIDYYKERFAFYKRNGIIEDCQYSDRIWFIWTLGTRGVRLRFSFDLDVLGSANDMLKCYTLFLLESGLSVGTIIQKIKILRDTFYQTNLYNEGKIEDFYEYVLLEVPKSSKFGYITNNIEFFDFFTPEHGQEFVSRLKESDIKPYESKTRALPPFEDILVF